MGAASCPTVVSLHPMSALDAISPIDGRYASKTAHLRAYFSEQALIHYRLRVELEYLVALSKLKLPNFDKDFTEALASLRQRVDGFGESQAMAIKNIEARTNHDVKAVEYWLKEQADEVGLASVREFIHFGLTSQDVNNTAIPLLLKEAVSGPILQLLEKTLAAIETRAESWAEIPMLARTHGQPASPTRLGKEIAVFAVRLSNQLEKLKQLEHPAKFGGATGNLNAHVVAYPNIDWDAFADEFVESLGLIRSKPTTQIEHYDGIAELSHLMSRIATLLIDLCQDMWQYISMEYFQQQTIAGEVGSSAMPHKVNPIDFENAEGNLGLARALFGFLADKLPISRQQRDLTDSTVLRNIGVPFAHMSIALESLLKGLNKLKVNESAISQALEQNWMVVAEAIQTVLRREGYPQPYEALKELTRGQRQVGEQEIQGFIRQLQVSDQVKTELLAIRPENYLGLPYHKA